MKKTLYLILLFNFIFSLHLYADNSKTKLAYLVTDERIPFWAIMGRGIKSQADALGYDLHIYNALNSQKKELELTVQAIKDKVAGIIISPSTSSACVTVLNLAHKAHIPVVISDVGTDSGDYISYISSNNKEGAYLLGKVLAKKLYEKGWQNAKVGIVAIPQTRLNGRNRTAGFMQALKESHIKGATIKQLINWNDEETYAFSKEMIERFPDLKALWLQTSNSYKGALKAIKESGREILLIAFDAEPEFLDLISNDTLIGSAMQQPYLMGEEALKAMNRHLKGEAIEKEIQVPILSVSKKNLRSLLPTIRKNVLGME